MRLTAPILKPLQKPLWPYVEPFKGILERAWLASADQAAALPLLTVSLVRRRHSTRGGGSPRPPSSTKAALSETAPLGYVDRGLKPTRPRTRTTSPRPRAPRISENSIVLSSSYRLDRRASAIVGAKAAVRESLPAAGSATAPRRLAISYTIVTPLRLVQGAKAIHP